MNMQIQKQLLGQEDDLIPTLVVLSEPLAQASCLQPRLLRCFPQGPGLLGLNAQACLQLSQATAPADRDANFLLGLKLAEKGITHITHGIARRKFSDEAFSESAAKTREIFRKSKFDL